MKTFIINCILYTITQKLGASSVDKFIELYDALQVPLWQCGLYNFQFDRNKYF